MVAGERASGSGEAIGRLGIKVAPITAGASPLFQDSGDIETGSAWKSAPPSPGMTRSTASAPNYRAAPSSPMRIRSSVSRAWPSPSPGNPTQPTGDHLSPTATTYGLRWSLTPYSPCQQGQNQPWVLSIEGKQRQSSPPPLSTPLTSPSPSSSMRCPTPTTVQALAASSVPRE